MKPSLLLVCVVLLACAAIPASGQYVYVRSNVGLPWGQTSNETAMDDVFGPGTWTTVYYETLDASLFASSNKFIFLEGGDTSFLPFQTFMSTYLTALTTWIDNGGRLLIMSAPNDPLIGESVTLPDNITLSSDAFYASAASYAFPTDLSNPIFSGPFSTASYFTGDFFSHGYFNGTDVDAIMESNLNEIVLGEDVIQSGLMVFGGMTTDNFQLPQPSAHSLLDNIIYYTAYTTI